MRLNIDFWNLVFHQHQLVVCSITKGSLAKSKALISMVLGVIQKTDGVISPGSLTLRTVTSELVIQVREVPTLAMFHHKTSKSIFLIPFHIPKRKYLYMAIISFLIFSLF